MAFNTYKYTNYEYAPEHDLEQLATTYNYLQQRHDSAVAQESAIKQAIGQLDLNAAEDIFKQKLVDETNNIVQESMLGDFKGYALNELVAQQGNIMADPRVIGRLRAQQEYTNYQKQLDANANLPENIKNYYKSINTYKYKDIYDNNGKVIGGTEWTPTEKEVMHFSPVDIMDKAIKIAAVEQGQTQTPTWLDANGNPTNDVNKSPDKLLFNVQTQKYERLSKEKIRGAIQTVINSDPAIEASLHQDWKVGIWDDKNGRPANVRNASGQLLSYDEYVDSIFDPMARYAAKNHLYISNDYNMQVHAALAKRGGEKKPVMPEAPEIIGIPTTRSNNKRVRNNTAAESKAAINTANAKLSKIFENVGKEIDVQNTSPADLRKIIQDMSNGVEKYNALQYIDEIESNKNYIDEIKRGKDPNDQKAFEFVSAIDTFSDLPEGEIRDMYNEIADQLFTPITKAIENTYTDKEYAEFINTIGGEQGMKNAGFIDVGMKNGKHIIQLPRENKSSLYLFAKTDYAARQKGNYTGFGSAFKEMYRISNQFTNDLIDYITGDENASFTHPTTYRVMDDGSYDANNISITRMFNDTEGQDIGEQQLGKDANDWYEYLFLLDEWGNRSGIGTAGTLAAKLQSLYGYVEHYRQKADNVFEQDEISATTDIIGSTSPQAAVSQSMIKSGVGDRNTHKQIIDISDEEFNKIIGSTNLNNVVSQIVNPDTKEFEDMNSEDKMKYTAIMRNNLDKAISKGFEIDENGKIYLVVTVPEKGVNKDPYAEPVVIRFKPTGDTMIDKWENSTNVKAIGKYKKLEMFKKPLPITDNTSFANIPKYELLPNNIVHDITNDEYISLPNNKTATELIEANIKWKETINAIAAGVPIVKENYDTLLNSVAETYAKCLYGTVDKNTVDAIAITLNNNLNLLR